MKETPPTGSLFPAPVGSIPEAVMPDALHLSPAGHRLWAGVLEPFLAGLPATTP